MNKYKQLINVWTLKGLAIIHISKHISLFPMFTNIFASFIGNPFYIHTNLSTKAVMQKWKPLCNRSRYLRYDSICVWRKINSEECSEKHANLTMVYLTIYYASIISFYQFSKSMIFFLPKAHTWLNWICKDV